jgi:hypothetical protein
MISRIGIAALGIMAPGLGAIPPTLSAEHLSGDAMPVEEQSSRAEKRRLAKAEAKAKQKGPTKRAILPYGIPETSRAMRRSLGIKPARR